MLRTRLLAAAAVAALASGSAAMAQDAPPAPAPTQPTTPPQTPPAPTPVPPAPAAVAPSETTPAPSPQAQTTPAAANTVIDVLRAQGHFTTLLAALDRAQLTDTLKSRPAISIFAPTDEAFAAMPEADRTRLLDPANAQELRQTLLYHVIVADVEDAQIKGHAGPVETAAGSRVQLDGTGAAIKADDAMVTQARLDASNGAVFAIDHVLSPGASQVATGDNDSDDADAAPAANAPVAPPADEATEATPAPTATPTPASPGVTERTTPAAPGATAPNGQPAATTTTVASPPVHNPTDGQVDRRPDASRPTPPVQTPDPADGDASGDEPNPATSPAPAVPPRG